jgi:hypothetical protein
MRLAFVSVVAFLNSAPVSAITLADLDAHLDAERGFRRDGTDDMIGTNAAFCKSLWGSDRGRREECEKEHGTAAHSPHGQPVGATCAAQSGGVADKFKTCMEQAQSAR